MKKILMVPAVIGLLAVPSFALAHVGGNALDVRHEDKVAIPATPATPAVPAIPGHDSDADDDSAATPATPAVPATSASPASVDDDSDDVAGQVETEAETSMDDSSHHANVSVSADDHSVRVGSTIDE